MSYVINILSSTKHSKANKSSKRIYYCCRVLKNTRNKIGVMCNKYKILYYVSFEVNGTFVFYQSIDTHVYKYLHTVWLYCKER